MKGPAKRVTVHYTHRNSWYGPFVLRLHVHPVWRYDSNASFQSPVLGSINGPVACLSSDSTDANTGIRTFLPEVSLCIAMEIASLPRSHFPAFYRNGIISALCAKRRIFFSMQISSIQSCIEEKCGNRNFRSP